MSRFSSVLDREQAFQSLYGAVYPDLIRFVQRRGYADQAEDIAADAFLVVWRRLEDVPQAAGDARAWIFGITRNILLNNQRGEQRRQALGVRLGEVVSGSQADAAADLAASRADLSRAWRLLSEVHQEALGLAVFEDLTASEAASVLGISPVAYRLRLSRARRTLRLFLEHLPEQAAEPAVVYGRTMS
ncbi:RNA polymerase sigma factor [Pseudarthrobacter sp. NamE5]|uniref:RNA polymerase sigma factor n=1 Tax=Pseudarthrobacter sp. NamE5 TaxID=2576839 RepID=UPI00110A4C96|nr:RNA polymerase sigma factor [Pseudarthrobacter sp. NamE5]TLM80847.1 RNA polymerase sigma factor [Pseudarthrobacter sp. NamE5]